ncbi:hypothetical protein [Niastella yeongjuensis]|uniref:hypothetical protein n=1 Tax=Niastella yeongjuensis TaxID=354355 RepID=UPI0008B05824|nr:hypothetical protein [Niastella yeongjuensis]SEN75716.1 hypothetical protein SAMN05660816_01429 [Niastella yeongjuensis]
MKLLKPLILVGCLALLSTSCKKAIEKKVQDLVMDAITHGEWIVEQYFEGTNNLSSQFLDYRFKFNEDGTLTGTANSSSTDGTWKPNVTDYTITADFPTAVDPLKKLNGLWKIKDSDWDYVKAEMQTTDGTRLLILRKK